MPSFEGLSVTLFGELIIRFLSRPLTDSSSFAIVSRGSLNCLRLFVGKVIVIEKGFLSPNSGSLLSLDFVLISLLTFLSGDKFML